MINNMWAKDCFFFSTSCCLNENIWLKGSLCKCLLRFFIIILFADNRFCKAHANTHQPWVNKCYFLWPHKKDILTNIYIRFPGRWSKHISVLPYYVESCYFFKTAFGLKSAFVYFLHKIYIIYVSFNSFVSI